MKKLGIVLIISSFILAYFLRNFIFPFALSLTGFLLLWIYNAGKSSFKFLDLIKKYPNEAYDWLKEKSDCWKIYEEELPSNYKDGIPSKRMKPMRLIVPKIGNRMIYIFGKFPECRESEKKFIEKIKGDCKCSSPQNKK